MNLSENEFLRGLIMSVDDETQLFVRIPKIYVNEPTESDLVQARWLIIRVEPN